MRDKLSKLEKQWILYDVGNSAFIMLSTTVIPIVFNKLADAAGLNDSLYFAYWSYAVTVATLVVGLLGPILGTISDIKDGKKKLFTISLVFGVVGCILMPFTKNWFIFLIIYVVTRMGYNSSLIFYDSMLTDITTEDRMDRVSSHGYAWGYIGSVIPFSMSMAVMFFSGKIGLSTRISTIIAFMIIAVWWLLMSLPLLKNYKQRFFVAENRVRVKGIFKQLGETFKEIAKNKKILLYLLAFFFYIDGVYTIINMATAYGTSLGLDSLGLVLALLVTQIVAFPCALGFSYISKKYKTENLIKICIFAYTAIALYAIQLDKIYEFWILAILVGMFQGAIQALSRSYYAKIIPVEKSGEYFGIYDIFGKGAAMLGTLAIGLVTQFTGNQQYAVGSLAFMFIIGLILFHFSSKEK
ncbi:MFS transporter [Peptoniphilaceae bacterium SGI.131]